MPEDEAVAAAQNEEAATVSDDNPKVPSDHGAPDEKADIENKVNIISNSFEELQEQIALLQQALIHKEQQNLDLQAQIQESEPGQPSDAQDLTKENRKLKIQIKYLKDQEEPQIAKL